MEQSHHRCLGGDHEPWGLAWLVYCIALQNAAYVKALGQIEIILSVMVGYFFFKERLARREVIAMSLLVISILMLILLTWGASRSTCFD